MGALSSEHLDALASTMGKIKFSPTGANVDEFTFEVKRRAGTLFFKHDGIDVAVSDFAVVDFDHWEDDLYPAVEDRIIKYLYSADVSFSVGNCKNKSRVVLGYWKDKQKLLEPLGRERDLIDTLLTKIDKAAGVFSEF